MKPKNVKNIFVYHRKDGMTTFSEYLNAKRHNIGIIKTGSMGQDLSNFAKRLEAWFCQTQRKVSFQGDSLDPEQLAIFEKYYNFLA